MHKVLIVINSTEVNQQPQLLSPTTAHMVSALKGSILAGSVGDAEAKTAPHVEVMTTNELSHKQESQDLRIEEFVFCPLTLDLPDRLSFPAQSMYQNCRDVMALRQQVQQWNWAIGEGHFWLPIVWTAKGPLYAEVIGLVDQAFPGRYEPGTSQVIDKSKSSQAQNLAFSSVSLSPLPYTQPIHLTDVWRQPLYQLGHRLLHALVAPPAVYLMQFGVQEETICFDRLFPFPADPAISSIGVQTPDLFACHWYCLTNQPIYDLAITG